MTKAKGGKQKQHAKQAKCPRGGGNPNRVPTGAEFLRFHTGREMIDLESAARESGDDKGAAFWKACQMRRARRSLRRISRAVGIPRTTLQRMMLEEIARRRRIRYDDDRYRRRGELQVIVLDSETLFGGVDELNMGKKGRPFTFGDEIFKAIAIYRAATGAKYRQIEGMLIRLAAGRFRVPSYSSIRKRIARLSVSECEGHITIGKDGPKYVVHHILIDGSGMRSTTRSAYRTDKYGNAARGYYKVVVATDAGTNRSLAVEVLSEKVGDSPALLKKMVKKAFDYVKAHGDMELGERVIVSGDGGFDGNDSHRDAAEGGYDLNCPAKKNSAPKAPAKQSARAAHGAEKPGAEKPGAEKPGAEKPGAEKLCDGEALRHRAVLLQQGGIADPTTEDYEEFKDLMSKERWENTRQWAIESGYTLRNKIEAWFGGVKSTFGDGVLSKKPSSVKFEVECKISIYNHMIDDAVSRGYEAEVVERGPDGKIVVCNRPGRGQSGDLRRNSAPMRGGSGRKGAQKEGDRAQTAWKGASAADRTRALDKPGQDTDSSKNQKGVG